MKAAIILAVALAASGARADCICRWFDDPDGEAWLHYELTDLERIPEPSAGVTPALGGTIARPAGGIANEALAGFRLHGIIARHGHLAYHAGLDLFAGGTADRGGFAYDVAFYPLGVGVRIGRTSLVALGTGIVATGATRWLDDGVGLPLEATVELGAGRVRFLGRARVAVLAGTHDDAAPSLAGAHDELEAMAGLRVGHHYQEYGFPTGNGYFLAVAYKEMLDARYVGLTLGYSIDAGTRRGGYGHRGD